MFIPSAAALDMLAAHAPRPWCKRLLEHLVYVGKLNAYSLRGKVIKCTYWIARETTESQESGLAFERSDGEEVLDEWSTEFRMINPELMINNMYIDWDSGELVTDDMNGSDYEWICDAYGDGYFRIVLNGLSFELSQIEMFAPYGSPPAKEDLRHNPVVVPARPTGRPRKHDWEGALIHVLTVANTPDGLPAGHGAQAAIMRMMQEWFQANGGEEPTEGEVKNRARRIMETLGRK
ncbi:hypothetical protein [Azospirillum sp. sgz302134]